MKVGKATGSRSEVYVCSTVVISRTWRLEVGKQKSFYTMLYHWLAPTCDFVMLGIGDVGNDR